ncbi:MAG: hypothetical protein M0008_00285 [Actinomycetota bacterium]|nr:hypothetical protein [Actinomycetota bacterium]
MSKLEHADSTIVRCTEAAAWMLRVDFMKLPLYNPAVHHIAKISDRTADAELDAGSTRAGPGPGDRYVFDLDIDPGATPTQALMRCELCVTEAHPHRLVANTVTVVGTQIEASEIFTIRLSAFQDHANDNAARDRDVKAVRLELSTAASLPEGIPDEVIDDLNRNGRRQVRTELENMKRILEGA